MSFRSTAIFLTALMAVALSPLGLCVATAGIGGGPFVSGYINGSNENDVITGVAKLPNGDVVVCGNAPLSEPWGIRYGLYAVHNGGDDGFVAILDSELDSIKLFTFIGGPGNDHISGIAVRDDGTIVIVGDTESKNMPTTIGVVGPVYSNFIDGFVMGLSFDLAEVKFCTYIVGDGDEIPTDVELDENGAIYICGSTTSRSGFPTNNGFDKQHDGGRDGFLCLLSPNCARYQFSTYFGSDGDDVFNGMFVDPSGSIYLAGSTTSESYPTYPAIPDRLRWWLTKDRPYDWTYGGGNRDAVVTVFTKDGAQVVASSYYGGVGDDEGIGLAQFDDALILVGRTTSPDLGVAGGLQSSLNGSSDVFLARFDSQVRLLRSSTYFGGSGDEFVDGAMLHSQGEVLVWGRTSSNDFPAIGFGTREGRVGSEDAFFSVMNTGGVSSSSLIGGPSTEKIVGAFVEDDGGILLCGSTASPFIVLEGNHVLENTGPRQTDDGIVLRFEHGGINLTSPAFSTSVCLEGQLNCAWNINEMEPGDRYVVEVSLDQQLWTRVAEPTSKNSIRWIPTNEEFVGQQLYLRIRSGRRHATYLDGLVRVDPKLKFLVPLPSEIADCGEDDVTLKAGAAGVGLTYTWRRDGLKIPGGIYDTLVVSKEDREGRYSVVVFADCGSSLISNDAVVRTLDDVAITKAPLSDSLLVGEVLDLRVVATDASTYQWYHNEIALENQRSPRLVIVNVALDHAGKYLCVVSNECSAIASEEAVVVIEPVVSVQEQETNRAFGLRVVNNVVSSGAITIEANLNSASLDLRLVALDGRVIQRAKLHGFGQQTYVMSVGSVPTGTYVLSATDNQRASEVVVQIVK